MLSVKEAAKKLNLTPQQIRNLCREGKIKSEQVGRTWVIDEKGVADFFDTSSCGIAKDQIKHKMKKEKTNKPIALSFFSGAMGMDIGLEKAGFETIFASEINNACRKTILKNRPDITLVGDIREYTPEEILETAGLTKADEIDLIVGGPPCQAFSTAGKRKGFEDERGNVFLNFINVITTLRPKYAVIENVRGLLSAPLKHRPHHLRGEEFDDLQADELTGGALSHIISKLEEGGYSVSFNLYNSANFGTPQKRERVVIICSRDGQKPPYLEPTHSEKGEMGLPKWKTFKEAVAILDKNTEHQFVKFPEKRLKYYRMLKAGENWRALSDDLQREAMGKSYFSGGGKTGFFRRLAWDKPAPTLLTHPAMPATDLAHPKENRPLSVQEYQVIQEFPLDWQIEGSVLDRYKQIGNAVPVGLGFAIGNLLQKLLNKETVQSFPDFKYSRYRKTNEVSWKANFEKELNKLMTAAATN